MIGAPNPSYPPTVARCHPNPHKGNSARHLSALSDDDGEVFEGGVGGDVGPFEVDGGVEAGAKGVEVGTGEVVALKAVDLT